MPCRSGWASSTLVVALFVLLAPFGQRQAAEAGKHPLQRVAGDSMDLVVTLDWDPLASTPNRDYLDQAFATFGSSVNQATQGLVRVCKIYVYPKNRHAQRADISLSKKRGRPGSTLDGINCGDGKLNVYTRNSRGNDNTSQRLGTTMAHELGHYGFGVKDEYTERQNKEPLAFGSPRTCDVTLRTLMGQSAISQNFSTAATYQDVTYAPWRPRANRPDVNTATKLSRYLDCSALEEDPGGELEDGTFRTSHHRIFRMSAWELLISGPRIERLPQKLERRQGRQRFAALADLEAVPTLTENLEWDQSCFEVIHMAGTVTVLAIDVSQSMDVDVTPGVTKFDRAILGAMDYVDSVPVGDSIGIVVFEGTGVELVPVTAIEAATEATTKTSIKQSLAGVTVSTGPIGSTNVSNAMIKSLEMLVTRTAVGNKFFTVVISDGEVAVDQFVLDLYKDTTRIPIYTVGMRAADDKPLKAIADGTGGRFLRAGGTTPANFSGYHPDIKRWLDYEIRLGNQLWDFNGGEQNAEIDVEISNLDEETNFSAGWPEGQAVTFELIDPAGNTIASSNPPAGITYLEDSTSGMFTVTTPMPGTWKAMVTPQSIGPGTEVNLDVRTDGPLGLAVDVSGGERYPAPFLISALVSGPDAVVGARVIAQFEGGLGDGEPADVALLDDGIAPDDLPNDGVYTGAVATITTSGEYPFVVIVDNPDGTAMLDTSGQIHGADPDEVPVAVGSFVRRQEDLMLEVTGARAMPQVASDAIMLRNDLTPLWGTFDSPGDVVWYQFNGYARGEYAIMTGNLIANDQNEAATRVTLYDEDAVTELASDAGIDGTSWIELDTSDQDKVFFLKVEHANGGVGRFQVAVAPREWLTDPDEDGSGTGGSGGGCGCTAGGDAAGLATTFGLFFMFLMFIRRRPRSARDRG